jgi:FkbM family methyltransferase
MENKERQELLELIAKREQLKNRSRLVRLFMDPIRAFPYYILAALGHLRPQIRNFYLPWGARMSSYFPEGGTFYYYGYCEANLTSFLLKHIKPGDVCLDVGAHVGYYVLLLSKLFEGTCTIHIFEPTPRTFALLKENAAELTNVTINNLALADTASTITFSDYGPGYGAFNTAHPEGASGLSIKPTQTIVPCLTLDAYVEKQRIHPTFIKLDAEGFEHKILRGAASLLNGPSPRPLISLEIAGGDKWNDSHSESLKILEEAHYVPFDISSEGELLTFKKSRDNTYDNIILIPEELLPENNPKSV